MPQLRLFGAARDLAGTARDLVPGRTVAQVLGHATDRYGGRFGELLPSCRIWVNGEPSESSSEVEEGDEVAVLPPVSGG